MYPYRVFVSYSTLDTPKMEIVKEHLKLLGLRPMDLTPGTRFTDEIKRRISYAHLFIVILTSSSKDRPWVHQEIGYAMGQNIPILLLALSELPAGMAEEIQAITVREDLTNLAQKLTAQFIDNHITTDQKESAAKIECADRLYERSSKLVSLSKEIRRFEGQPVKIRQRMAFGSFSIPNKRPDHRDWMARDRINPRTEEERIVLRQERDEMEEHASIAGCDLIINPYVLCGYGNPDRDEVRLKHPPESTAVRCRYLKEFLEQMPDEKVRVVIQNSPHSGGLILIGDLCMAEAIVPFAGGGYRQTVFTRHGPTVLSRVRQFDELFNDLLDDVRKKYPGKHCRDVAVEELDKLIADCERTEALTAVTT